jgi:tetratricopeptide (TPR) repeat protein
MNAVQATTRQPCAEKRRGIWSPCHRVTVSPCHLLVVGVLVLLGAEADPEAQLRQGNAAFFRGDYAAAAEWYEKALGRTNDPGLVAFNLASAKYRLAVAEEDAPAGALAEAEQYYRCCLGHDDPRRPQALVGLGNCLLRRAEGRDAAVLREAVACYELGLREAGADAALADDARHNLERARLLLLQFQPPAGRSDEENRGEEDPRPPQDRSADAQKGLVGEPGEGENPDPGSGAVPVKPQPGAQAQRTNEPPPPGQGNLKPLPDNGEAKPLTEKEAAEHLRLAAGRIHEEQKAYRQSRARTPGPGVRDW